ncbi:hypothetical protein [Acetobacterium carbinolicum]|uniref:hypothetical protein n=1 Tax=Acetobacterium carbinolicum TaxID=52690 RepID=UPI0039C977D2
MNNIYKKMIAYFESIFIKTKTRLENVKDFPVKNGIYILKENENVVYIGKAKDQTIKERCEQYTRIGDTGNTVVKNIMKIEGLSKEESQKKANKFILNYMIVEDFSNEHFDMETCLI